MHDTRCQNAGSMSARQLANVQVPIATSKFSCLLGPTSYALILPHVIHMLRRPWRPLPQRGSVAEKHEWDGHEQQGEEAQEGGGPFVAQCVVHTMQTQCRQYGKLWNSTKGGRRDLLCCEEREARACYVADKPEAG